MAFDNGNGHKPDAADLPDAAHYIGAMVAELARLAERHELDMLAYILNMARLEADQIAKGSSEEAAHESAGRC